VPAIVQPGTVRPQTVLGAIAHQAWLDHVDQSGRVV
jgi:hypothetical protein